MPKRGENIRKRKDGRWEARIKTESGKLRSVYAKTYSELKTKLKDSNEKQKLGNLRLFEPKTPFLSLTESFLKESEIKNKKSTVSRYREIAENHLIPFFKNTPINSESVNTFILYKLNHETRAIEQKMDIKAVSEILGHSTVSFTLERYVHISFEFKKQNIEKLTVCY